jgi:hypothetical protein
MSPGVNMAALEHSDISNLFLGSVVEELLWQFLDESSLIYEANRRSDTSGSSSGDFLPDSSYGDGSLFDGSRCRLPAADYQKCSRNGSRSQSTIGNPIHARKAHRPTKHERQSRVQVVRSTEKALYAELREVCEPDTVQRKCGVSCWILFLFRNFFARKLLISSISCSKRPMTFNQC